MYELKPCPFCGSKADIKHANIFMDEAYYVKCGSCYAMTKRFLVDHPCLIASTGKLDENTRYDALTAINKAAEAWNKRAGNHGAWEMLSPPKKYESGAYCKFRCSECGVTFDHSSRYCSACGARMDGKEKNNE